MSPKYSVGNLVWDDVNNDGVFGPGEHGIGTVSVRLRNASGAVVAQTITDSNGYYLFANLDAGAYSIEVAIPSGYVTSTGTNGSDTGPFEGAPSPDDDRDNDDNGTNSASGYVASNAVTLSANEPTGETTGIADNTPDNRSNYTVDFGFFRPAALGDRVFEDSNRNGVQDSGEVGVPGVSVQLFDAAGNLVRTTVTDSDGLYLFTNLIPGTYRVVFVPDTRPAGTVFTTNNTGPDDLDSDADETSGRTGTYTLQPGDRVLTVDAGIIRTTTATSTTTLATSTTSSTVTTLPVIAIPQTTTTVSQPTTTATPSTTPGTTPVPTRVPDPSPTVPATPSTVPSSVPGEHGDLTGRVYVDTNRNGIQDPGEPSLSGVAVRVTSPSGVRTATTDANGDYRVTNIAAGDHSVEIVGGVPAEYASLTGTNVKVHVASTGSARATDFRYIPRSTRLAFTGGSRTRALLIGALSVLMAGLILLWGIRPVGRRRSTTHSA